MEVSTELQYSYNRYKTTPKNKVSISFCFKIFISYLITSFILVMSIYIVLKNSSKSSLLCKNITTMEKKDKNCLNVHVNDNICNLVNIERGKRKDKNHGLSWLLKFALVEEKGSIKRKEKDQDLK